MRDAQASASGRNCASILCFAIAGDAAVADNPRSALVDSSCGGGMGSGAPAGLAAEATAAADVECGAGTGAVVGIGRLPTSRCGSIVAVFVASAVVSAG